jgi:hypothetical protein
MKTTGVIFATMVLLLFVTDSKGQISPGELAQQHSHLEGMSNCTKCHTLGAKVSNNKCLTCHKEIQARIFLSKGYHASPEVKNKSCSGCHSDHHGRNFDILNLNEDKFNHNLTGYKLEGSHAKTSCRDCHQTRFVQSTELKKKKGTFLGLDSKCASCHEDYHQQTLSNTCSNCHTQEKFKPASKFNHDNSKFVLKGKHKTVDCSKCHPVTVKNNKDFQQFTGIRFDGCTNCHNDPHENKFGQNCTYCHTEESFKLVKNLSNFDHDKTRFKLIGKHEVVSCKSCHKNNLTASLKHNRCADCHSDFHKGQFVENGAFTDCKECHTEQGFQQSSFSIERHNKGKFKLEGAHIATPCTACHLTTPEWKFKQIGFQCKDCHKDIHEAYLDKKYYPEANCLKCHSSDRWDQISFDHNQTNYQLEGKHQIQSCRSCHEIKNEESKPGLKFTGLTQRCSDCHLDNHNGQFNHEGNNLCSNCHKPEGWAPSTFDHDKSAFKLDGKHEDVACIKCHPMVEGPEKPYVLYKTGKIQCKNCH